MQPLEEDAADEEEGDGEEEDVEETAEELAELERYINEADTLHPYREKR